MPAANRIIDRETKADLVYEVLAEKFPGQSIDTVASRPLDYVRVLLEVCRRRRKLTGGVIRHVLGEIETIEIGSPQAVQAINDLARATLSSRKRGGRKVSKGGR